MSSNTIELNGELGGIMKEMLSVLREGAPPLSATPQGQDIIQFVKDVESELGVQTKFFSKAVGARRFVSRAFTFSRENRGKKSKWKIHRLELAAAEFLSGSGDHLRALLQGMNESEGGQSMGLWLAPLPTPAGDAYFVFIRHWEGQEATFVILEGQWRELSLTTEAIDMTLEGLLKLRRRDRDKWSSIIAGFVASGDADLTEAMQAVLKKYGIEVPDAPLIGELVQAIYFRKGHLQLLQEAARAMGTSVVQESQALIEALTGLVLGAIESSDQRLAHMEKDHKKALDRFKADLAKFKLSKESQAKRTRQLEQELTACRRELQAVASGPSREDSSLGLSLDAFFAK